MYKKPKNIIFGMSELADGQMILDGVEEAAGNRARYFNKIGLQAGNAVSAGLVHGISVAEVGPSDLGRIIENVDGLITNEKDVVLTITASDCLPLYFYDEVKQAVGLAHAGWRGVVGEIAPITVKKMAIAYGCAISDIKVYIGPHIRQCHFEIKDDILGEFVEYPSAVIRRDDRVFVDLEQIVKTQLIGAGINAAHITSDPACTYCDRKYFSYRRDRPTKVTSQVTFICLQ